MLTQPKKRHHTLLYCLLIIGFILNSCGRSVNIDRVCEDEQKKSRSLHKHLPELLSETGLDKAELYTPQFKLWTDGADKQRYIYLPDGAKIDSSDMDSWVFPEGTKLWKTFLVEGKKIETRILQKSNHEQNEWLASSYIWKPDGSDAVLSPAGGINVLNTQHDVPASDKCMACHGGRKSVVLGFSAVQLSHQKAGLSLNSLSERGVLSTPVKEIPELSGSQLEKEALGYLHANCSHCHNPQKEKLNTEKCFIPDRNFYFNLSIDDKTVHATQTYQTSLNRVFLSRKSNGSDILRVIQQRGTDSSMPPIGTEVIDAQAVQTLTQWIQQLSKGVSIAPNRVRER